MAVGSEHEAAVFRALADPTRRLLLDALFVRDGQTLLDLCGLAPEMTRFGVSKHLRVLEAAGLVVVVASGRHRLHYLNAVPIEAIASRWLGKYSERIAAGLNAFKDQLEGKGA